jgi:hypothetical protein
LKVIYSFFIVNVLGGDLLGDLLDDLGDIFTVYILILAC